MHHAIGPLAWVFALMHWWKWRNRPHLSLLSLRNWLAYDLFRNVWNNFFDLRNFLFSLQHGLKLLVGGWSTFIFKLSKPLLIHLIIEFGFWNSIVSIQKAKWDIMPPLQSLMQSRLPEAYVGNSVDLATRMEWTYLILAQSNLLLELSYYFDKLVWFVWFLAPENSDERCTLCLLFQLQHQFDDAGHPHMRFV